MDLLYGLCPYLEREKRECDDMLNVLRYDERKVGTFVKKVGPEV